MIVMIIIAVPILKSAKHFTKTILGLEAVSYTHLTLPTTAEV